MQLIATDGGREITAYGIRHIAAGVVHDILCIVCDGAILSGIGDIFRCLLRLRGRARRILDFCHGRIHGIDLMILILPILVLNLEAILCRSDFRIGLVAGLVSRIALDAICGLARIGVISLRIFGFGLDTICCHIRTGFCPVRGIPVFGIIDRPFFIMGELALGGMAMICYFSQIRDPIRRDGGSTIMLFAGCCIQLIIFQVDLAYIELAIDRQVFLYGDIFLKCCFAFRGQCAIERGIAIDTELAVDLGILEISIARSELAVYGSLFQLRSPIGHGQTFIHLYGFLECRLSSGGERTIDFRILEAGCTSHIERAIHIRLFELGIACDRERLIHGHVALELRSIFHFQRACVHIALRGDIASASIHAIVCCQLAFRSHIANAIDNHIVFDRSFVSNVIVLDSGGALIGRINSVLIGLNVICIRLNLALELGILRFEVSDIALCRCHITLQICDILTVFSDFPFQLCIFSGTRYCLCSNSVRIDLRLCIKCFQVFRNTIRIALLDIVSIFSYLTDAT